MPDSTSHPWPEGEVLAKSIRKTVAREIGQEIARALLDGAGPSGKSEAKADHELLALLNAWLREEQLLRARDLGVLAYANGMQSNVDRSRWGYRAHFCPVGEGLASCHRLAIAGLMERRTIDPQLSPGPLYTTTARGRRLLGLPPFNMPEGAEREN